ncbi:MAG: EamA family transporter [Acidobacteria bacterium]|nr:EamA family transporter [Acidobacteriota bacterium]
MRTALFVTMIVLSSTGGEITLSHVMKRIGEVKDFAPLAVLQLLGRAFRTGWMWIGITLMAIGFFSLLVLLSWEDVSFVVPATALSYVVGTMGARFVLDEQVSIVRWMGVLLVCIGVAFVWAG